LVGVKMAHRARMLANTVGSLSRWNTESSLVLAELAKDKAQDEQELATYPTASGFSAREGRRGLLALLGAGSRNNERTGFEGSGTRLESPL
jgi:hypothetical protein